MAAEVWMRSAGAHCTEAVQARQLGEVLQQLPQVAVVESEACEPCQLIDGRREHLVRTLVPSYFQVLQTPARTATTLLGRPAEISIF